MNAYEIFVGESEIGDISKTSVFKRRSDFCTCQLQEVEPSNVSYQLDEESTLRIHVVNKFHVKCTIRIDIAHFQQ